MACGSCRGRTQTVKIKRPITMPQMRNDGSIEYPEGHEIPVIEGYVRDEENPNLMVPEGNVSCEYKITGIGLQKDGSYKPMSSCRNSLCEHSGMEVTHTICSGCPLRSEPK